MRKLMPTGPLVMWNNVGLWATSESVEALPEGMDRPMSDEQRIMRLQQVEDYQHPRGQLRVSPTQREDWASGRLLDDEEKRCGMLTTVGQCFTRGRTAIGSNTKPHYDKKKPSSQTSASTTTTQPILAHMKRLSCVIKAHDCDWQLNELHYPPGHKNETSQDCEELINMPRNNNTSLDELPFVTITRRPKGKWVKVRANQTAQVETNIEEEKNLPFKHTDDRVVNFGEYRHKRGNVPVEAPLLRFSCYRESTPLQVVLRRAQHLCRLPEDSFSFASDKESFGCVSHLGSAVGVSSEMLPHVSRHYNIRPIILNPLEHTELGNAVDHCAGASWRVLLRCVNGTSQEIEEVLEHLTKNGFVNYVPLSAFSICTSGSHEMMAYAANGNYVEACRRWFQSEAERNPVLFQNYMRYIASSETTAGSVIKTMAQNMKQFRPHKGIAEFMQILGEATDNPGPGLTDEWAEKLWKAVPRASNESVYIDSCVAFIWNAMVSQRLLSYGASSVVAGDMVQDPKTGRVLRVASGQEGDFSIHDVVMPLPHLLFRGAEKDSEKVDEIFPALEDVSAARYREFIHHNNVTAAVRQSAQIDRSEFNLCAKPLPSYRKILSRPEKMEYRLINDPNSVTVMKSDLFLRQERKVPKLGLSLNDDTQGRIRDPCEMNVSQRFRQRMEPVIALNKPGGWQGRKDVESGTTSVALSCFLPRGAHMTTMLREGFNVRHAHFHDLLTPHNVDW